MRFWDTLFLTPIVGEQHSWTKVAICRSGFCDGSARERKPGMRRGLTEIL